MAQSMMNNLSWGVGMLFFCLCLLFMQTETFDRPILNPCVFLPLPFVGAESLQFTLLESSHSSEHPEAWCCQSGGGCGLFAVSWPWVVSVSTRGQSPLSCLMLDSYNSWIPLVFVIVCFDALFDVGVVPFWWYPWCGLKEVFLDLQSVGFVKLLYIWVWFRSFGGLRS
jgi:hypothetical protein